MFVCCVLEEFVLGRFPFEVFVFGCEPVVAFGLFVLLVALLVRALGGRSVFTAAFAPAGRAATTPGP